MQQYFITQLNDQQVVFNPTQSHHLKNVLRMKPGQQVLVVDQFKHRYLVTLTALEPLAVAQVVEQMPTMDKNTRIVLAMAMIKKDKWEWLIQKACEFGVDEIIPLMTQHCVVKGDSEKLERKLLRWNTIAMEACEQSKRNSMVTISEPIGIKELVKLPFKTKVVAYELATTKQYLTKVINDVEEIVVVIGPEGGLAPNEVALLVNNGYLVVSLGERILRAESAGIYALTVLDVLMHGGSHA
jgi:16S rRNA (uracil1498-N3)-methyltransferase